MVSMASCRGSLGHFRSDKGNDKMFSIAVVLLILWLLGFFAFHVTNSLIHVLLAAAVVAVVAGFIRRSGRAPH
jgi:hypothetical protein